MAATSSIARAVLPITSLSIKGRPYSQLIVSITRNFNASRVFSTQKTCTQINFSSPNQFTSQRTWNSNRIRLISKMTCSLKKDGTTGIHTLKQENDLLDEDVDPVQRQLLEEQCIVLNDNDQVIGHDTKRNCHKIVDNNILLHRAFSVFLFNGKGELYLQQRSKTKITFPLMWTNTCCSHPLHIESELIEKDAIGVKMAARRRLEVELGIPQESINLNDFQYLCRIQYKALSNTIWGEHEIDYILFLQKDDLKITPNPDEINESRWVSLEQVKKMVKSENVMLTPWFELILNSQLPVWWKNLDNLTQFKDHESIHRLS